MLSSDCVNRSPEDGYPQVVLNVHQQLIF